MEETELSRELAERVKILDEAIETYHKLRSKALERIDRGRAKSLSLTAEPGEVSSTDDSSDMTELYLYNLALIVSNELKVSHRVSMGLVEIIDHLVRVYPKEVQEQIQGKLAELKASVAEIPF